MRSNQSSFAAGRVASPSFVFCFLIASAFASTEKVVYRFQDTPDGATPYASLVADSAGNLYGTTALGGSNHDGTVFELSPPATAGGAWTETVLYSFQGSGND